jgi:5-methylcytosine-specific restriction enzyme A
MSLADLSSPAAVKAALKEYDKLGREKALELYGFGFSAQYLLKYESKPYDSKAIAGIAHQYQFQIADSVVTKPKQLCGTRNMSSKPPLPSNQKCKSEP